MNIAAVKTLAIAVTAIGALTTIFAPISNSIFNGKIQKEANANSSLSEANEKNWSEVPGVFNFTILKDHYLFNCTNYDDVVFKNAAPVLQQFGPYTTQEQD